MSLAWSDDAMLLHDPGPQHAESPSRLTAARQGLEGLVQWRTPTQASTEDLVRVHDPAYVQWVLSQRGKSRRLDPDTLLSPGSVDAAALAAGAAVNLVDALLDGETEVGWALVRPPGHHAERGEAMGFCVFNNVAVAAAHALSRGVERVAVVDWDLHHGNGTQHLFQDRNDVLFYSSHQFGGGFYPGTGGLNETGSGRGQGFTVNAPLWAGSGDADALDALTQRFLPRARDFQPQLILISAGFDGHVDDPLGALRFSEAGFAELARRVADLAAGSGAGVGLVLEGGYDLAALRGSVRAVALALG